MNYETGKWIIGLGVCVILLGIVVYFFHDKLHWLGRLPGDILVERQNFKFYFPVTTMILFSILLTAVLHIVRRFF